MSWGSLGLRLCSASPPLSEGDLTTHWPLRVLGTASGQALGKRAVAPWPAPSALQLVGDSAGGWGTLHTSFSLCPHMPHWPHLPEAPAQPSCPAHLCCSGRGELL